MHMTQKGDFFVFIESSCRKGIREMQNTCSFTLNKLNLNKMLGKPNNIFN